VLEPAKANLSALLPLLALAQAGGGGSFGGGGGSFGGGGGGGDGGGDLLFYLIFHLIRFAIEVPVLGVPLLIVTIICLVKLWRAGFFKQKQRTIRKQRRKRRDIKAAQSVELLKESDPEFNKRVFLARVKQAFLKSQESWCAQDMSPVSLFLSDGINERFSIQIDEQTREGWRQGMKDLAIRNITIADVGVDDEFDMITVRVSFKADIHRLKLKSGKKVSGSTLERSSFSEAWTFIRGHGAKTLNGDGLMEGYCPNCGAELVMRQSARCEHCDCHAKSGQFDWVLAEITQWSEWAPESAEWIPGYREYKELDPGLHPQVMEDLASVVFWRLTAARQGGDTELIHGHTTEDYLASFVREHASASKRGARRFMTDCAVGSVRTTGLLSGTERDRAVMKVVYDGYRSTQDADGELDKTDYRVRRTEYFVFSRRAGAKTERSSAFSTAHCYECGAHDDGGATPNCRYCDAPRFGDPSLWLLEDVLSAGNLRDNEVFKELASIQANAKARQELKPTNVSAMNLLMWSLNLLHHTGAVTKEEREMVHAIAGRAGLTPKEADGLLNSRPSVDESPKPADKAEGRAWLEELCKLALEDGNISKRELRFLQRAAHKLGIPQSEYKSFMRSVHVDLYRQSKSAKRRWAAETRADKEPPAERAWRDPKRN